MHGFLFQIKTPAQLVEQTGTKTLCDVIAIIEVENNGELITTESGKKAFAADSPVQFTEQSLRYLLQQQISRAMPKCIVHLFKTVEVNKQQREPGSVVVLVITALAQIFLKLQAIG